MIKLDFIKKLNNNITLKVKKEIKKQEFLTIFGESGAGKTTLLRILSGLEKPDRGKIVVNDKIWFDSEKKINIKPQKREIGFVFQDYTLFPNMSVYQNLLFAKKDKQKADFLLRLTKLEDLKNRYPHQLSGGQKQRVALIRALMREPKILLLDEPLSALDIKMRQDLQDEIVKIHKELKITTILVSHDIPEVIKLSNRVFVLKNGKIIKDDKPINIFIEEKIASSFKFNAAVIDIKQDNLLSVLTLQFGSNIVQSIISKEEAKKLKIGDSVLITSKAFNPIIQKIST